MSAIPATSARRSSEAPQRISDHQVISGLPKLTLVPTPAPARGFIGTVVACLVLFLGAFGLVFFLNTKMVATAYEIQNVNREINAAAATLETLTDEVVHLSTPNGLSERASELGLEPATDVRHLDLATGSVVVPADPEALPSGMEEDAAAGESTETSPEVADAAQTQGN